MSAATALSVERIGRVDADPVEYRQTLIRGDRFAMSTEWPGRGEYGFDVV